MNLDFTFATEVDAKEIADLVNMAYRGEQAKQGWTTEADILDGQRTDRNEIRQKIKSSNAYILMANENNSLIGSCEILVDSLSSELYFGMFTIRPDRQNKGYGKAFLNFVEKLATEWNLKHITMTVITLRTELIEYYKRRGYQLTDRFIPFPAEERFGIPKVKDLKMVYLKKDL